MGGRLPLHRTLARWLLFALVALLAAVLQWGGTGSGVFHSLEHLIKDPLRRAVASTTPEERLVVIDLDEASIGAVGPWPWPRARVADLVEALAGPYGARAIGVDVVFPAAADAGGDARLAALGEIAPVVFAQALDFVPRSPPLDTGTVVLQPAMPGLPPAAPATGYVGNHAGLAGVRCVGNIGLQPDADGRVRRVPLVADMEGKGVSPLLPAAMLGCPLQRQAPLDALSLVPPAAQPGGLWELPFPKDWSAYTVIPARAILDGSAPVDLVQNRWVLVGSSALGLNDRAATPLAAAAAGVMVHAAALTSLLDLSEGAPPPLDARWIGAAWTVLTLAAAAWALGRFRAVWLVPGLLLGAAAWMALAAGLLSRGAVLHVSAPLLGYLLVLLVIAVELWMTQREQSQLLRSFGTYVAPSVLNEMLRLGLDNPMVPQHRQITVVSADMQDYTGLTNRSTLQDAALLTREFLQCLTEPVLAFGGTLDKYTGDGLVAFWGAPLQSEDHAQQALRAAQAMVENVRAWNERRVRDGGKPARVRIGVESGPVLVGDLGTAFRRTYTAVGDCINTASKLQQVAKTLRCDLVVGPVAARASGGDGLAPVVALQLPGHHEVSQLWFFPSLGSSVRQDEPAVQPG